MYYTLQEPIKATELTEHSLLDGIPCRKSSFRSFLHLITWHLLGSGLQLRTWLTNKDVSFTSNWPNGMVRRRALNPSAFTARHVQQRQLQNKKQKKLPFTVRTKIPIEMLSTVKQNFTSARSCKSAKWICSFFSKGTGIQWFRNYYTTTGTAVVFRSWSGWSISQVCPCCSVSMPVCLHKRLSAAIKTENSSSTNAEEHSNLIQLLTHSYPDLYPEIGRECKAILVLLWITAAPESKWTSEEITSLRCL